VRLTRSTASLSVLLIAVALAAVVFAAVRRLVPVPGRSSGPALTGDMVLYESARPSQDLAVRVGPNRFKVAAVARNDRDGVFRFEDGRGKPLKAPFLVTGPPLTRQSGWLDEADVYLNADPTRLDVIELRVFDHATRTLLTGWDGTGANYVPSAATRTLLTGWDGTGANYVPSALSVRLLSFGRQIPDSVDVWFRAASHPAGNPITRLKGVAGSSVPLPGGSLSVREIRAGASSYSVRYSPGTGRLEYVWAASNASADHACSVVFDWQGNWGGGEYQVCAVGRDGRKLYPDVPHVLDFRATASPWIIAFKIAPADLSHFELRPYGGRHTFYFDGVKLPKMRKRGLWRIPTASLAVDGREVARDCTEFDPVRVSVRLRRGECCRGVSSDGIHTLLKPVERLDTTTTVFLEVEGIAGPGWDLAYFDRDGKPLDVASGGRFTSAKSGRHNGLCGFATFNIPLDRIGRVEVSPTIQP